MEAKKVIKEIKTPIKYLVKKLNKIDSSLTVKPLTDNPDYIVFNGKISEQEEVLYYFNQRQYSSYGLMRFIEDHNTDDFIEINKAINVWLNSKEKNGSTMPFEDDISNDSQKKPVLPGLYTKKEVDSTLKEYTKKQESIENELKELGLESKEKIKRHFIDYLLDNYFNPRIQTMLGETTKIEILDPTLTLICTIDFSKEEPVSLNISGRKDANFLKMLIGLSANILQMLKNLDCFKQLNKLKEDDNEH